MKRVSRGGVLIGLAAIQGDASLDANARWVPAATHASGVGGALPRRDVSLLNFCPTATAIELRLHEMSGVRAMSAKVPARRRGVFADVVAGLVTSKATGSLEIASQCTGDREIPNVQRRAVGDVRPVARRRCGDGSFDARTRARLPARDVAVRDGRLSAVGGGGVSETTRIPHSATRRPPA